MKKCWAKSLGNCAGKISKEHIVSEGLSQEEFTISGFPWLKGKTEKRTLHDLCSHSLCVKHNNDLSKFDSEIINLNNIFKKVNLLEKKFVQPGFGYRNSMTALKHTVNGLFLEKWFSKTLINVVKLDPEYEHIKYIEILPYIYGNKNFEEPYGLYMDVTVGLRPNSSEFFSVCPIFNDAMELSGAIIFFGGFNFRLQIPTVNFPIGKLGADRLISDFDIEGNDAQKQLYWHNREIKYEFNGKVTQKIVFSW